MLAKNLAQCYVFLVKPFFLVMFLGSAMIYAQEFVAPGSPRRDVISEAATVEMRPTIEGIVKEVFETKKPWQMVNPVAPARYGSGQRVLSKDFGPGTPYHSSTITLLSVEW